RPRTPCSIEGASRGTEGLQLDALLLGPLRQQLARAVLIVRALTAHTNALGAIDDQPLAAAIAAPAVRAAADDAFRLARGLHCVWVLHLGRLGVAHVLADLGEQFLPQGGLARSEPLPEQLVGLFFDLVLPAELAVADPEREHLEQ